MDNQLQQLEWSETETTPMIVKVIDVWQKRGKKIEELTTEDIEEAILYKH